MSASRHVTLWCDFGDCAAWTDHGERDLRATRRLARAEGWLYRDGEDFCCASHAEGRLTMQEELQRKHDTCQRERLNAHFGALNG